MNEFWWRSLLPGGLARGLQARGDEGGEDEDHSGDEEGSAEAVGEVAGESHDVGAGESAEGSDGVDESNASGSGGATKEEGGKGPEGPDGSPYTASSEENHGKREDWIADGGAGDEGKRGSNETGEEMPLALAGAVGVARDEKHGDDGQTIRDCG